MSQSRSFAPRKDHPRPQSDIKQSLSLTTQTAQTTIFSFSATNQTSSAQFSAVDVIASDFRFFKRLNLMDNSWRHGIFFVVFLSAFLIGVPLGADSSSTGTAKCSTCDPDVAAQPPPQLPPLLGECPPPPSSSSENPPPAVTNPPPAVTNPPPAVATPPPVTVSPLPPQYKGYPPAPPFSYILPPPPPSGSGGGGHDNDSPPVSSPPSPPVSSPPSPPSPAFTPPTPAGSDGGGAGSAPPPNRQHNSYYPYYPYYYLYNGAARQGHLSATVSTVGLATLSLVWWFL